jgi:heme-degrading monooxygenase HmoA
MSGGRGGAVVQLVWEFVVRPKRIREFERHYSASGTWAALFRRSPAYQGTELLRDVARRNRYLTVDRWDDLASHRAMRRNFAQEYEELDRMCEALTESEGHVGDFEAV